MKGKVTAESSSWLSISNNMLPFNNKQHSNSSDSKEENLILSSVTVRMRPKHAKKIPFSKPKPKPNKKSINSLDITIRQKDLMIYSKKHKTNLKYVNQRSRKRLERKLWDSKINQNSNVSKNLMTSQMVKEKAFRKTASSFILKKPKVSA